MTSYLQNLESRFLRYVQINTQSDETSSSVPSTAIQLDLLRLLVTELEELGTTDVVLTDYGCVMATIPATIEHKVPTVAFLAHVDTAPAFNGNGVKPIIHRGYNGQEIILPDDKTQIINFENSPQLAQKIGEDIVTASGTTLLGADDKAGIAIIMTMADYLLRNPHIPHGNIRVCFTPDEEIGRGVVNLELDDLRADVAYTLDGGTKGEVTYETFSADKASIKITGISAHPGYAQGQLVNALSLACNLVNLLPQESDTPETTSGREGFMHLYSISGTAAYAELHFILRDFELEGLAAYGNKLKEACHAVQQGEPRAQIEYEITPQYRNMRYWLEKDMKPVELALQAIDQAIIKPIVQPVRGGTDGSGLTEKGLPTPNLFTGMQNLHGPLEWISLQDMAAATEVCVNLVQLWAKEK
ncbi:MAG: peptidase T [Chloroflexi bacterium]|nr:MAG: peptidase T [Chloroflexota bacterium]